MPTNKTLRVVVLVVIILWITAPAAFAQNGDLLDLSKVDPFIIAIVPFFWGILEGLKKYNVVEPKWLPFVNATLSLLAGGGDALLQRQDLTVAIAQVVVIFLMTAGSHDIIQPYLKRQPQTVPPALADDGGGVERPHQ